MPTSVPEILARHGEEIPDKTFAICGTERRTYAEMADAADRVAAGLRSLGIASGDRVAVLAPNRIEYLELFFGIARLGAVQVPLNVFLKGEFLRHQLANSAPDVFVGDASALEALGALGREAPGMRRVLIGPVEGNLLSSRTAGDYVPFGLLRDNSPPADLPMPAADQLLSIMYTSGTTGPSKGCMLTHEYYSHIGTALRESWELRSDDVLLTALQLFHTSGQAMALMIALTGGATVVFEPAFSASRFIPRAVETGATAVLGIGAMGQAILGTPPAPADREHKLRFVSWAPMPEVAQVAFEERFGVPVMAEYFGQTECVPISINPVSSGVRQRGSAGRAAPWNDVRVVDDQDHAVPNGTPGEIVVRPREPGAMFQGYWGNAEATVATFRNLWHHTGDLGRMDDDGFLTFVDRKKDAMRRRGENVSSMELEARILQHEKVAQVAVHAVPSELSEDDIKACIVLAPDAHTTPEELFEFFAAQLPYFAVPRYVELLSDLPVNAMNRVMKAKLRERGITPQTWDLEALGLVVERGRRRDSAPA